MQQGFLKSKNKILFIGGNGSIGSVVSNMLAQKYLVISPKSKDLDWSNLEQISKYLSSHNFETLINLSYFHNASDSLNNIYNINNKIIDNIIINSHYFKRIIHIGSIIEESGLIKYRLFKNTQNYQLKKRDVYEINKYYALSKLRQINNFINLRIPPCFGHQGHIDKYINYIIDSMQHDEYINNYNPTKDSPTPYLYVYDIASIIDYIIEHEYLKCEFRINGIENVRKIEIIEYINNFKIRSERPYLPQKWPIYKIRVQDINSEISFNISSKYNIYQYIQQCLDANYSVSR